MEQVQEYTTLKESEEDLRIYLTFPANSSFTDDEVSKYFSEFGAVRGVTIPNQRKQLFGFVTFVNAETVKAILGREAPHIICGSHVVVKPFKYKGKAKALENMIIPTEVAILREVADVDIIINRTRDKVLVLRFGCSSNHVCRRVDDVLKKFAKPLSKLAKIAFVENDSAADKLFRVYFGIICTPTTVFMYNYMDELPADRRRRLLQLDFGSSTPTDQYVGPFVKEDQFFDLVQALYWTAKEGKNTICYPILPDGCGMKKRTVSLSFSDGDKFKNYELEQYFHCNFGRVEKLFVQPGRKFGTICFVYAETVRHVLSYTEPHVICGCNVQVQDYKTLKRSGQGKYGEEDLQIHLKFPANSSFTDDEVSKYFSEFGAVRGVTIPHQRKRVFGFVTFVDAETVKAILAKGTPHFICGSRVVVNPFKYKGKGKALEN